MAKLVLGRQHWASLTADQRSIFADLFTRHVKPAYFNKLDMFSDQPIEFEEPVRRQGNFHMTTYITTGDGEQIALAYKLYRKHDSWIVYDLEISGISLVRSYRSQYDEIIRDSGATVLLERMQQQIVALHGGTEDV